MNLDLQTTLFAAIAALWAVLTAVVSGALKWLIEDRKTIVGDWAARLAECRAENARKDERLDEATDLLRRQNASLQAQIEALQIMIKQSPPPS